MQPMEDVRLASAHPCSAAAHWRDLPAHTKVHELSSSTALFLPPTSAFARLLPSLLASEGRKMINLLVLINTGTPVIA